MPQAFFAVGMALFQMGAPLGLASAFAVAGGFLTTTAGALLLAGGAFAVSSMLMNARAPSGQRINSPEVRGSVRQPVPSQRVIYGSARVGGAVFFLDDSNPPYLYLGLLLSSRRISAMKQVFVGQNPVEFLADTTVITPPYENRLWVSFRDGDPDQLIDPIIAADFPDIPSTFRQRGHATVVFKMHYGADYDEYLKLWGNVQIPVFMCDVEGCPVYDPRDPTQIMYSDPDDQVDVAAAMATWKYSNNASLVQADYLMAPYGGRQHPSVMRWDEIAKSASYDDQMVELKDGGWQKRYTIDGVITKDQERETVMQSMLTANRGFVAQSRGRAWVTSSKPEPIVLTVHDGMMVGGFEFRDAMPKKDTLNHIRTRFVAPDREYTTADGPIRIDATAETADGEILEGTIQLPFTLTHQRAQRIAKASMQESRMGRTVTCGLRISEAMGIEAGQAVRVWSDLYPMINGIYRVNTAGFSDDTSVITVSLIEYDPTIDAQWNAQTDELPFVISVEDDDA